MAKKLTKKIDSQFIPTYINGVPTFMCGGKMKYNLGGMINNIKDFAKDNWSAALGPAIGLGALLSGKKANEFAQENAGTLGTVAGGALGLAVGNPMLGSQIGGQIGSQIQDNYTQQSQLQQPQQDMMKQQLISNLPGQSSYIPTFANGGPLNKPKNMPQNVWEYQQNMKDYLFRVPVDKLSLTSTDMFNTKKNLEARLNNPDLRYKDFDNTNVQNYVNTLKYNIDKIDKTISNKPKYKGQPTDVDAISYANGGEITDRVSSFDNGGLHSENGGIPIGQNSMVERDEFMYTNKQGKKYIFSNKF